MSESAKIDRIDVLKDARTALVKFAEAAGAALNDADSDIVHTRHWLEKDQQSFWTGQIRKRRELVNRAADAMRQKKLYKAVDGTQQSAVDEERALLLAKRRLEEAEQKLANTRRWLRQLDKEAIQYRGIAQRMMRALDTTIPNTVAKLGNMLDALDSYTAMAPPQEADAIADQLETTGRQEEQPPPTEDETAEDVEGDI